MGNAIAPLRPREPLGPDLRVFLDMIVDANEGIVLCHPDHLLLLRLKLTCHAEAKPKHLDQTRDPSLSLRMTPKHRNLCTVSTPIATVFIFQATPYSLSALPQHIFCRSSCGTP